MKKNFLLLLLVNICTHVWSQGDMATAKWMHVTVDGNNSEWGSLNFYDDQTQLNFGIANDSDNIYLCFATINEPVQMKIMHAGMKLTLSTKSKPKHEVSILFPLPQNSRSNFDSLHSENNNSSEHTVFNKETFRQSFIAHHTTMQVNGFANLNGDVPAKDSGVQVAVNWDSASNLIYEVAIAKKEFFGSGYILKDMMEDITLSVEVNGLPHSEAGSNNSSYHDMHGGQGGMHGGYGNHEGNEERNPMNNSSTVSLSAKTSFKQKFVLNNGSN